MNFLSIEELKKLDTASASAYCNELRNYIIDTVKQSGGHLASNLGIAEISVALIRCFDSPDDKIIYDVGHQSYVHKLLTGRHFGCDDLRAYNGYSGFTKREESPHDPFGAGHSSTALSATLGFSRASRLTGNSNYSVAVIGDGAFCTGMTFEALNNIDKDDKLIIILNDNEMSISHNVGTMSAYLNKMRTNKKYLSFKRKTKNVFKELPYLYRIIYKIKSLAKRVLIKPTFFEDLGVYYLGPADGNDLESVENLITEAKTRNTPVLIHLITKKGKGLPDAETDPGSFHFVSPVKQATETFSSKYTDLLIDYASKNDKAVAITAAMCDGTGLTRFKEKYPNRLFDVGISEEHAATFSAALAAGGLLPFYTVYSTFFQRSYDQVIHDISLQKLKVVIALDRAGLVGADGPTHHGIFDVSMMMNVPNTVIYSPSTFAEMEYSFKECTDYDGLSVIRYPKGNENKDINEAFCCGSDYSFDSCDSNTDVLFITYGRVVSEVLNAKKLLTDIGYSVSVLKFLKLKPIDLNSIKTAISSLSPKLVIVIEEGMKIGGFGEHLLSELKLDCDTEIMAIDDIFVPHGTVDELYDFCLLSSSHIYSKVVEYFEKT